jgi:hypothetical protein
MLEIYKENLFPSLVIFMIQYIFFFNLTTAKLELILELKNLISENCIK